MTPPDSDETNFPCPHGRASWHHCPHCLGLNQPIPYAAPTSDVNESAVVIGNDLAQRILAALEHSAWESESAWESGQILASELRAAMERKP